MRIRPVVAVLGALALLVLGTGLAAATPMSMGLPGPGHSWTAQFTDGGGYSSVYNQVDWYMTSPSPPTGFETVAASIDDSSGWSVTTLNAKQAFMSGSPLTAGPLWTWSFLGSSSTPLTVRYVVWDNSIKLDAFDVIWSGSSWSYPEVGAVNDSHPKLATPSSAVPEPASLCLLTLAVCGAGFGLKRRPKKV